MDDTLLLTTLNAGVQAGIESVQELTATSLNLARQIMQHTREGIVLMDARGRVLEVNPAFCRLSELDAADIEGRHLTQINESLHERRYYRNIWLRLQQQGDWQGEVQHHNRDGQLVTHRLMLRLVRNHGGRVGYIIGILDDISQLRQSEDQLSYLAHHDALTRTANRTFLLSWFNKVTAAISLLEPLSLLFIDLDRFKPINDSFGHGVGDEVLKVLADRLQTQTDANEIVARIGGDEFVMIWRGTMTRAKLMARATSLLEQLQRPVLVGGHELSVGASIGISFYPEHGRDIDTLLRYADTAMYQAKCYGSTKICLFDGVQLSYLEQQQRLTAEFHLALEEHQLFLEYQPTLATNDHRLVSVEALLRWRHPELGVLYPDQFLSAVKAAGLLLPLAEWVFTEAARQVGLWQQQHHWRGRVSINLSGLELEQQKVGRLLALLQRHGVAPEHFILELCSDFMMRRSESLTGMLNGLRDAGIKVFLNNVGKGRFNFSKLGQLPIDGIKLDHSLLTESFDSLDRSVIRSLLLLSQTLGIRVIACGVEHEQQMRFLRQYGCDAVQGRLLASPIGPHELDGFIATSGGADAGDYYSIPCNDS
ncbi:MAG: EAL domain-containing protein [Oceanisphaera sp.]|nr:EAL domain-containing protein [Oceanisphaera sp.]